MATSTAIREEDPLVALAAAMRSKEAAFMAQNAFSLFESSGTAYVSRVDLLKRLAPALSASELDLVRDYIDARQAAHAAVNGALRARQAATLELGTQALDKYASRLRTPGWYEFEDKSQGRMVQAKFVGFDSCYRATDGKLCGSIRVSPQGNGSSEPWSFYIEKGRMVVRTLDLY